MPKRKQLKKKNKKKTKSKPVRTTTVERKNETKTQNTVPSNPMNRSVMSSQEQKEPKELLNKAGELWKKVKQLAKEDKRFVELSDKDKLKYFREELGHREFMNEYPVMTRYMICMGQYSAKAFNRFLTKLRITKHPPADKREKGYMEDQWIRRQADYVQYLWEAYKKGHYDTGERQYIWQQAYKNLRGEFDDFRDKYKEIEKTTKEQKKEFKASNARDLLERLKTRTQNLNEQDSLELLQMLKQRRIHRWFKNTLQELTRSVKLVPPCSKGIGQGPDKPDEDKPVIKMIEHVDGDRIDEIPQQYMLDKHTAKGLPMEFNTID